MLLPCSFVSTEIIVICFEETIFLVSASISTKLEMNMDLLCMFILSKLFFNAADRYKLKKYERLLIIASLKLMILKKEFCKSSGWPPTQLRYNVKHPVSIGRRPLKVPHMFSTVYLICFFAKKSVCSWYGDGANGISFQSSGDRYP